jgi:hypothetical protein
MKIEFEHLPVCFLEDLAEIISDNIGFPSHHVYWTFKDEYLSRYCTFYIDFVNEIRMDMPTGPRKKMFDVLFEMMNNGELPERFVAV